MFKTVLWGMRNLAIQAMVPDLDDPFKAMIEAGFLPLCIYAAFVFIVSITMMNMLIGVLCEVIGVISTLEREEAEIEILKSGLVKHIAAADEDKNEFITVKEFTKLLANPEAVKFMASVDIDALDLVDFVDTIFKNGRSYDYAELIGILMSLRGKNTSTVKDITDLRSYIDQGMSDLANHLEKTISSRFGPSTEGDNDEKAMAQTFSRTKRFSQSLVRKAH